MRLLLFFLFIGSHCWSQGNESFSRYLDAQRYYFVDSVLFQDATIYVAYDNEDESVIIKRTGPSCKVIKGFLPCFLCRGKGSDRPTYVGSELIDGYVVFVHEYFSGRDSVFVDFSDPSPTIKKVIRHSFFNERTTGPDDGGNYMFLALRKVPVDSMSLPVDRNGSFEKRNFRIEPIVWRRIKDNK